jgi:hypothetical protein
MALLAAYQLEVNHFDMVIRKPGASRTSLGSASLGLQDAPMSSLALYTYSVRTG